VSSALGAVLRVREGTAEEREEERRRREKGKKKKKKKERPCAGEIHGGDRGAGRPHARCDVWLDDDARGTRRKREMER
jgi:hypothetical protein